MPVEPPARAASLSAAGSVTEADTAAAAAVLEPMPVIRIVAWMSSRRRLSAVMLTSAVLCTDAGSFDLNTASMAAATEALRLSNPASESVDETGRSVTVTVTRDGSTPSAAAWSAAALEAVNVPA